MKLSTRGRYGLRFVLELARRFGDGPIFLGDIARKQDISEKYLGQLVIPLKNADLIRSQRGAHGGYMLTREPSAITLRQVVEAVEGSLALVECVDHPETCSRSNGCIHRDVWARVTECISGTLESITLQDLVDRSKKRSRKKKKSSGGKND